MEPTAQGVLAKTPLAHLIVYCVEKKLRGGLILRPEGDDDSASADVLTLVDGFPAKIKIPEPIEHLGRILVELGAIDDGAYNESLMALGRGEGLVGEILMRAGKIDAAVLEKGLRVQIARKLGQLFSRPSSTRYMYYDGADFLARYGGPELFPCDPTPAVFASIRANPSMPHADATVEKMLNVPLRLRAGSDLGRFDLSRTEKDLVALLKLSPMTPAQLAAAGVADARTARLLVYGLLLLKQVEPAPAPVHESSVPPGAANPALKRQMTPVSKISVAKMAAVSMGGVVETGAGGGREPAIKSSTPPAAPQSERRAEIAAKVAKVAGENHFQMLGIPQDSTPDDAKNAYFQLAKRWHPDRLPADLADLKDDVAKVFALMAEAYQTLTDQDRRVRYMQVVKEGGGTPQEQAEIARVMEASNAFQKAEFFVNKGSFGEAEPHAARAYELEPKDPDNVAVWCWIQANKPDRRESSRYDDLLTKLEGALTDSPRCERARFYRGMILKAAGRMGDAIRDFREIAESNPRHTEAVREVRLYTMRHERDRKAKDEGSGSLLGRFMKKK